MIVNGWRYRLLNKWLLFFNYQKPNGIFIGRGSRIAVNTIIGNGTRVNGAITIKGKGKVKLGNYCALGDDIVMISSNHESSAPILQYALSQKLNLHHPVSDKQGIEVGHNVWMGDRVILLPGISVGNGSVIAAGSVVTKDVAPYAVVAGVPAKKIHSRISESKQKALEASQWWEWSIEKMKEERHLFE